MRETIIYEMHVGGFTRSPSSGCRSPGFTIWGLSQDDDLHVMLNMAESGLDFEIPPREGRRWLKVIDTALPSPMDIAEPGKETAVPGYQSAFCDKTVRRTPLPVIPL